MAHETFDSGGKSFNITINPGPTDGTRHPIIVFVHGNFGLGPPYGDQILGFAADLAKAGYVTAVPQLYPDLSPHPNDIDPGRHVETLAAAIAGMGSRADCDPAGSRRVLARRCRSDGLHCLPTGRLGQGPGRLLRSLHARYLAAYRQVPADDHLPQ